MEQQCLPSQVEELDHPLPMGGSEQRGERAHRLESIVWGEIVPRLADLHHGSRADAAANPPTVEEIEEFSRVVIASDGSGAATFFQRISARGHSFDSLFEILLAPTARRLGELWEQDRCDFIDVTLGVGRLQELLNEFGSAAGMEVRDLERRVLLIATPRDTHVFGLKVVGKFLLSAGWDVRLHDRQPLRPISTWSRRNGWRSSA